MSITGERIRACRKERKMTLEEVALHLGIQKQAVYKYEKGLIKNIPLDNMKKLGELFDVRPEYLAGWTEMKEETK